MTKEENLKNWRRTYLKRLLEGFLVVTVLAFMDMIKGIFQMATLSFIITTLLYVVDISETLNKKD